mgnify:CR=1 FL=1
MSTKVEKNVVVDVPLTTVYNQWTQFEDFPRFMGGVQSVKQLTDDRLEWVAEIGGVRRQWEAKIVEQVPDSRVSWAATEGATNAGTVTFRDAGNGRTEVHLVLEYEPEGLVEKVGDKLNIVEKQAEGDLKRNAKVRAYLGTNAPAMLDRATINVIPVEEIHRSWHMAPRCGRWCATAEAGGPGGPRPSRGRTPPAGTTGTAADMTTATPGYRTTTVGSVVRRALVSTLLVGLLALQGYPLPEIFEAARADMRRFVGDLRVDGLFTDNPDLFPR